MKSRIYIVADSMSGDQWAVRATAPSTAIKHVVGESYTASPASVDELLAHQKKYGTHIADATVKEADEVAGVDDVP